MKTKRNEPIIEVVNAALDEGEGNEIVLQGRIAERSLQYLRVDKYQREAQPDPYLRQLSEAVTAGTCATIDLSMRGHHVEERDGNTYVLHDPVYIVDGQQRWLAARQLVEAGKSAPLRATIWFGHDEPWERERFEKLNLLRKAVAPSIILRNKAVTVPVMKLLLDLSEDRSLAVAKRVAWQQRRERTHLMTALTFARTVGCLHSYVMRGVRSTTIPELVDALERLRQLVGPEKLKRNTLTFFDVVDRAWGVRHVRYQDTCVHLRAAFLTPLAQVFAMHEEFWDKSVFIVPEVYEKQLSQFVPAEPNIAQLVAGTSFKHGQDLLQQLIIQQLNKTRRAPLTLRHVPEAKPRVEWLKSRAQAEQIKALATADGVSMREAARRLGLDQRAAAAASNADRRGRRTKKKNVA